MEGGTLDGVDEVFDEVDFFEVDFADLSEGLGDGFDVDLEVVLA